MASAYTAKVRKGICEPSPERPEIQQLLQESLQRDAEREAFCSALPGEQQYLCKIAFEARRMCQGCAERYEGYYRERFGEKGGAYLFALPKTQEFLRL